MKCEPDCDCPECEDSREVTQPIRLGVGWSGTFTLNINDTDRQRLSGGVWASFTQGNRPPQCEGELDEHGRCNSCNYGHDDGCECFDCYERTMARAEADFDGER